MGTEVRDHKLRWNNCGLAMDSMSMMVGMLISVSRVMVTNMGRVMNTCVALMRFFQMHLAMFND